MRFLIADDHSIVRMGLRLMLETSYIETIIDEAQNGNDIVENSKLHAYNLFILDFQMPNTDMFGIISYLLACNDDNKILIYTMASEKIYADKLFNAGVMGFLSKEADNSEVLKAVDLILKKEIYTSNTYLTTKNNNESSPSSPFSILSNKEMDILHYLIQGKTTKEISNLINLQLSTVSTHKARIYGKLSVNNLAELIALAKEYKLN